MVRGKGKKQVLGLGEIQGLKEEKGEIDATLRFLKENPGTSREDGVNKVALLKKAEYLEQCITDGTPPVVRGANKDRMVQEAEELKNKMRENMPTREEMDHPGKNPGAIAKHIKWLQRNDTHVRRYKDIQRTLEPDDPTACDIERLRKEK